jgi:hypothetical protein
MNEIRVYYNLLFFLRFGSSIGINIDLFATVAIFAGHLVAMNNPVMGSAGALLAFPSIRSNIFLVFKCFH